jgi:hypothetical protein
MIRGMTDVDAARKHAEMAREMAENMGHDSMNPVIHCRKEGEQDAVILLVGAEAGSLYDAVQAGLSVIPYVPDSIVLMHDGYALMLDTKVDSEQVDQMRRTGMHEPLGHRFAMGDPAVKEQISTLLMSCDSVVLASQSYRWTPVDGWEWDEVRILTQEDGAPADWEWDRLTTGQPRRSLDTIIKEKK